MNTMNYKDTYITDSHDFDDTREQVTGNGTYCGKPYISETKNLYSYDDVILRAVIDATGKHYELLLDGIISNKVKTEKTAIQLFLDFTGLSKRFLSKVACPT